jgi:hypothetical protein
MKMHDPLAGDISMTRRDLLEISAGFGGVFLVFCCAGGAIILLRQIVASDRGSPELAAQWVTILDTFADPKEAERNVPNVQGKRFANGEWVFGLCRDSHGYQKGRGTLVVKDSRGDTRIFFGHVCGPRYLESELSRLQSLDEFYQRLQICSVKEHEKPE